MVFVDFVLWSYWGGVVLVDVVEIGWDCCGCGWMSLYVKFGIMWFLGSDGDEYCIGVVIGEVIYVVLYVLIFDIVVLV